MVVVAVLVAVGFGVYRLGKIVDSTSNGAASHDSELTQALPKHHHHSGGLSHRTVLLIGGGIGVAAGVILLVSFGGAAVRARRRQRWHATS